LVGYTAAGLLVDRLQRRSSLASVLALFYPSLRRRPKRLLLFCILGSLWSYLLDVPAILAVFTIPGGSWIC
jgi:hypothetical protein